MEQMKLDTLIQELEGIHDDFKLIPVKDIEVAEWVRWKCEYGCKAFGKHLTCPPYTPRPEDTRKLIKPKFNRFHYFLKKRSPPFTLKFPIFIRKNHLTVYKNSTENLRNTLYLP